MKKTDKGGKITRCMCTAKAGCLKQKYLHFGMVRERGGWEELKFWIILPMIRE